MTTVIDATDLRAGRLATRAAKLALEGEDVAIVNSEKAVVTGNKDAIIKKYIGKRNIGTPEKGPHFPKTPDRILKRTIRGMLPYKKETGKKAFKRIKTYLGVPKEFGSVEKESVEGAEIGDLPSRKYLNLYDISKSIGYKK